MMIIYIYSYNSYIIFIHSTAEVMGVDVEILTDTSVRVSWERILNIPEITHYTVFYSRAGSRKRQAAGEQSMNVSRSSSSVDIEGLSSGTRLYQFAVVAVATVNNVEILGERSITVRIPPTPTPSNGGMYNFVYSDFKSPSSDGDLEYILLFCVPPDYND